MPNICYHQIMINHRRNQTHTAHIQPRTALRVSAILATLLLAMLLLAGCMPKHYSSEQEEKVANKHAADAEEWFDENLPDARMNKNVRAYTAGLDLYCAVRGSYEYQDTEYPFIYDYYNKEMYLGHTHDDITDAASSLIAKELGVDRAQTAIRFWGIWFNTKLDNDIKMDYDFADSIVEEGLVPASANPATYAKELVYEGNRDFRITVYGEDIPAYNAADFEKMKGLDSVIYLKPIDFDYEGTYRAEYSASEAAYKQIVLHGYADNVKAGFFYTIRENYAEDGSLTERIDPLDGNNGKTACLIHKDGIVTLNVPPDASPIVFVPQRSTPYISEVASQKQQWTGTTKEALSYYPSEMDYINGSLMVVPHSDLCAYYISTNRNTRGDYNLRLLE